ncbi:MAG TPA: hypothetical protein VGO00_28810 [Kofleriaceae bacterium]|nr:hypothetical protein [Kofleriaceae bacterium]
MRFGPWYSLDDAAIEAPGAENILQLRLPDGQLRAYPRGKSAMVHYEHATNARLAAAALAKTGRGSGLRCRHLIEIDDGVDLAAFHAKLVADFTRRFGTRPSID